MVDVSIDTGLTTKKTFSTFNILLKSQVHVHIIEIHHGNHQHEKVQNYKTTSKNKYQVEQKIILLLKDR